MKNSKIVQIMMSLVLMGSMTQLQAFGCLFKAKPAVAVVPIIKPMMKTSVIRRAGIAVFNGMKRHKLATAVGAAMVTGFVADKLYANRMTKSHTGKYEQYARLQDAVLAGEAAVRALEDRKIVLERAAKKLESAKDLVDRSSYHMENNAVSPELNALEIALSGLRERAKKYYGDKADKIFATHDKAKTQLISAENIVNMEFVAKGATAELAAQRAEIAKLIVAQFERIAKKQAEDQAELAAAHGKLEAAVKQAQDEYNALLNSDVNIAAVVEKVRAAKIDLSKARLELAAVAQYAGLQGKKQETLLKRTWNYLRQGIVKALSK